jgi:hypothetical protein
MSYHLPVQGAGGDTRGVARGSGGATPR